ncbi:competence type IV pilus minor pilin ComGD [Halobacillus litoralis]|uniref:competence type IV pilus minor pilin ComGD n=1 Tax=Halobacillus litoralis TaxID=45668 RepID=UPI001CFCC169|nr:competence type IV pilus minor pilin ComGD [Halobacillus litoralis]
MKFRSLNGYTLTETVIVLLCWAVMIGCFIPIQHSTYQNTQSSYFLRQFREDILTTQHLSMNDHVFYSLRFHQDSNQYLLYDAANRQTVFTRKLPDLWRIQMLTLDPIVKFNQNGVITKPGSMMIITPAKTYKIIFPFGVSRIRIEEV